MNIHQILKDKQLEFKLPDQDKPKAHFDAQGWLYFSDSVLMPNEVDKFYAWIMNIMEQKL